MSERDAFAAYHPLVNLLYFILVLTFSMFFMHPVCLLISLTGAVSYGVVLKGRKAAAFAIKGMLPVLLLTALINPAFNHQGVTLLRYLPGGNPLTLESILYGLAAGTMLAAVMMWFLCLSEVFTTDKFVYLFGRILPSLSLVLSMTLRFIPRFKEQLDRIREAQKGIGRDLSEGSILQRAKNGMKILSILITWAMENGIETADSMRSRGYGLKGRTAFSIYRFTKRDLAALCFLAGSGLCVMAGGMTGRLSFRFFPGIRYGKNDALSIFCEAVYLLLCLMPIALSRLQDRKMNVMLNRAENGTDRYEME